MPTYYSRYTISIDLILIFFLRELIHVFTTHHNCRGGIQQIFFCKNRQSPKMSTFLSLFYGSNSLEEYCLKY